MKLRRLIIVLLFCLVSCSPTPKETEQPVSAADAVFLNGNFITMDEKKPRAQALAVKDGKILAVGSTADIRKLAGEKTKVTDLGGKTVVPGMIDAHCHVLSYGTSLRKLNFVGTKSLDEIVNMVREKAKRCEPGEWILGRGWDQNDWDVKEFPHHEKLSAASPENPVCLTRICGHASFVNRKAMEIAGITKDTPDTAGGKIIKDKDTGEPTGVLVDTAAGRVQSAIPGVTRVHLKECIELAIAGCLKAGLTGVHDAGVEETVIGIYRELAKEGKLNLRIYAMLSEGSGIWMNDSPQIGAAGGFLTTRSVKLFADGAMGSRGAALLAPYSDDPENSGLPSMTEKDIASVTREALKKGYQVCTHAIGDGANRTVLNGYEQALKELPTKDHRLRIEHAQVLSPQDIPRFAKLGVIPSMQPTHCTSDMYWATDRLGAKRVKGAYAWRSLLDTGARIAAGSDFPVESNKPLWGIYAAITRQDHKGWPEGGWHPQQKMTVTEALRSFTIDAAYAAFEENIKGSLEKGKFADLVVLSKDITKIPPKEILQTEVEMTFVGGKIVYKK
jgi:predicted amidohydrolase YtcJ